MSENISSTPHKVSHGARCSRNGHEGGVIWFTGLSASGKTTLATLLERRLFLAGYQVFMLDGDNLRCGLCSDLGFSEADRGENIRRAAELSGLFAEAGVVVISSFISPFQRDRSLARELAGAPFHEIYLNASLSTCEERDPKGLYARARAKKIQEFTGVSSPYEVPDKANLMVNTGGQPIDVCLDQIYAYVMQHFPIRG